MSHQQLLNDDGFSFNSTYQPFDANEVSNMDDQIMYQDARIQEQDIHLESITMTARDLKHIGIRIGDELDDQEDPYGAVNTPEMLDDLDMGMENTSQRMKREIDHIVNVSERAKAGG
eukprot:gene4893-8700_t